MERGDRNAVRSGEIKTGPPFRCRVLSSAERALRQQASGIGLPLKHNNQALSGATERDGARESSAERGAVAMSHRSANSPSQAASLALQNAAEMSKRLASRPAEMASGTHFSPEESLRGNGAGNCGRIRARSEAPGRSSRIRPGESR